MNANLIFVQIMSAGAIPVFVVRDWIKPFQETVDWPSFSFSFNPDAVGPAMVEALRAVSPGELEEMQVRFRHDDRVTVSASNGRTYG